jgi:putative ABC transport system permease protein
MGLDLRFALRQLRRNPAFTLAAALTLALRIALGARRGDVIGGVIRHSLGLAAPGVLLGLAGALAASRAMGSFLYDVPPTDPLSVAAACGIVALLVVGAALAPARRAADTDPMNTLRSE